MSAAVIPVVLAMFALGPLIPQERRQSGHRKTSH